ncbi:hypothetical protein [Streptomyces sp. KL2]|uniref:hypothetical protein n=1 Tax=Streptomyces sp. KL2 TaxID=3050126 RepID=UPI00397A28F9
MAEGRLPEGWTLQRIRDVSGGREAVALHTARSVTWRGSAGAGADEEVRPGIVLGFHGLCLVGPVDDEDWYTGCLNDDGSVDCRSVYGDLFEALRGP